MLVEANTYWNWSYRQLWLPKAGSGSKPRSSARDYIHTAISLTPQWNSCSQITVNPPKQIGCGVCLLGMIIWAYKLPLRGWWAMQTLLSCDGPDSAVFLHGIIWKSSLSSFQNMDILPDSSNELIYKIVQSEHVQINISKLLKVSLAI